MFQLTFASILEGKPISLPETIKIMEKEIKNAERAKTKYQLLQQLLAEQEQDDDWELIPDEHFVPDQSNELNELINSAKRKQQMCVCVVNNCMRIKGICKIEAEVKSLTYANLGQFIWLIFLTLTTR